jgi:transposase
LQRWYKDVLSDYQQQTEDKTLPYAEVEIEQIDKDTGDVTKTHPVYIFKPENIGDKMCIDDKAIGHEGYTIFSNFKTNKIALLMESTKFKDLEIAFSKFSQQDLLKIKSISSDMDATYLKLGEEILPHSRKVVDKFHVIRYVYDALLDVLADEKKNLSAMLSKGTSKTEEDKLILTQLSILRRCRYRLLQSSDKWTVRGKELMEQAFDISENLRNAYYLSQDFKHWYSGEDKGDLSLQYGTLLQWYKKVEKYGLKQFNSVVKMIKKHENYIINYFYDCHTNANAEQLNQKIQLFIYNNFGIKNKTFFMFRIAKYFS